MSTLRKGSQGEEVTKLQKLLNEKGNYGLETDGKFGSGTEAAVEDFQRKNALDVDGVVGSGTWAALENYVKPSLGSSLAGAAVAATSSAVKVNPEYANQSTWDPKTDERIESLYPELRALAKELIIRLEQEKGIKLRVTSGFRSYKEQNELYAKGRTTQQLRDKGITDVEGRPDKSKVTNALGGTSFHNFGLAIDIVEIKDGKALWTNDNWETIGAFGESVGWEWGGRWKSFLDRPHFQVVYGKSTSALRKLNSSSAQSGSDIKIK